MKTLMKFSAVIGLLSAVVFALIGMKMLSDPQIITYEQYESGEFKEEEVLIEAVLQPKFAGHYRIEWDKHHPDYEVNDNKVSSEAKKSLDVKRYGRQVYDITSEVLVTANIDKWNRLEVVDVRLVTQSSAADLSRRMCYGMAVCLALLAIWLWIAVDDPKHTTRTPPPKPIKTKLLGITGASQTTGGAGGAMVGAALGGVIGAGIGAAATSKTRNYNRATFEVLYDNGEKRIETVSEGMGNYDKYMRLLSE